jgi:hypothetical protein
LRRYVLAVLIGADIFVNATLGGESYTTLSCRIGESIQSGGWAAYVPWPKWLKDHFLRSVFDTTV